MGFLKLRPGFSKLCPGFSKLCPGFSKLCPGFSKPIYEMARAPFESLPAAESLAARQRRIVI
jgi:hypothetical protein